MPERPNTKKKIELTITGIGIIVLIFLLMSYLPKSKDNKLVSASKVTRVSFTSLQPRALSFQPKIILLLLLAAACGRPLLITLRHAQ